MRSHRALSSVVGAVFLIAIMVGALSYVTYSLEIMGNFSESLITEEARLKDKQGEAFEIISIDITLANKLDGVIKNTGQIPVKFTTLWVDEQGVNDAVKKYTIDKAIAPGNTVNLINLADVDVDPTKGYNMKIVTSRGEVNSFSMNSPNVQPLDLQLYVTPSVIPDAFESTILLAVHNNMTNDNLLMNIKPVDPLTIVPNNVNTIVTKVDGPIPASLSSLKSGETGIFKWTYSVDGDTDDYADFTVQLENGYAGNSVSGRITIGEIILASKAVTSFSSQGFNPLSSQTTGLLLHAESLAAPLGTAYQMDQRTADGAGLSIPIKTTSPDFFTNNGTAVGINAGVWNASLTYYSAPLPDSLAGTMDNDGGMIFHFEDAGAGIDGDEDNSADCMDGTKGDYAKYAGGMSVSDWSQFGGPHNSGNYTFNGSSDFFSIEKAKCNEIKNDQATLAARFYATSSGSGNDYIYYAGKDNGATDDHFGVKIDGSGNVDFRFETADNSVTICTTSGTNYRDNAWHHVVAVRDGGYSCKLYLDGNTTPAATGTSTNQGDEEIKVDNYALIGARLSNKDIPTGADFFQGTLDDVMFWQKFAMSSTQMADLYNTNYGDNAHDVTYTFSITDVNGNNLATIKNDIAYPMNFSDGKRDDKMLKSFNYSTGLLPFTEIGAQERLKFEMLFVDFTEALQMTFGADDNSLATPPGNSYIDFPQKNATFMPFNIYDNDAELQAGITSNGPYGTWITKDGTRVVFNSTTTALSYGGIIKSVNGTVLAENQDSMFIGVGDRVDLVFHRLKSSPDDCWPPGPSCDTGIIPPGLYDGSILMIGYNDNGNENTWKISMGNIQVNE